MEINIKDAMKARLELLVILTDKIERKLQAFPCGRLEIKHIGGKAYYYHSESDSKEMILCKERNRISQLAQKNYLEKVLKSSEQEAEVIKRAIKQYPDPVAEEIYDQLSEERKVLVKPIVTPLDQFVKEWQEKPYIRTLPY